jgi:hypothetical protein
MRNTCPKDLISDTKNSDEIYRIISLSVILYGCAILFPALRELRFGDLKTGCL